MTLSNRKRLIFLCVWLLSIEFAAVTCADEQTALSSRRLLIDGDVLNADTGERVESFRVIPGVRYNQKPGVRGNLAVWQPNMIREMTDGDFHWPRTRGYDEMRFRVEADGYRPATTTWLGKGGPHLRMKVHLRPDPGIRGVLLKPDGTPAANATLAIGMPNRGIRLDGCKVVGNNGVIPGRLSDRWRIPQTVETDEQGNFLLPYETDRAALLCIVHPSGYFEQNCVEFTESIAGMKNPIEIKLENWGQIKGRVLWKDTPGAGADINAYFVRNEPYPGLITASTTVQSDAKGNYLFAYLPPGNVRVGRVIPKPEAGQKQKNTNNSQPLTSRWTCEYPILEVSLESSQTVDVDFGGEGVEVTGRLTGLKSYEQIFVSIRPPAPNIWGVRRFNDRVNGNDLQQGYDALQKADYGPLYFRENLAVNKDGTFTIQDVMTGEYNLWVQGASGSGQFTVDSSETKFSIGTIQVKPQ